MKRENKINRRDFLSTSTMAGMELAFTASKPGILTLSQLIGESKSSKKMEINSLRKRKLGLLEVTELGFGCMNIAWAYGNPPIKVDAVKLIRNAYEQGVRFFDTAEIYGPHFSE
jgi:hypothetical protein